MTVPIEKFDESARKIESLTLELLSVYEELCRALQAQRTKWRV